MLQSEIYLFYLLIALDFRQESKNGDRFPSKSDRHCLSTMIPFINLAIIESA
jgi:hypothetical protein